MDKNPPKPTKYPTAFTQNSKLNLNERARNIRLKHIPITMETSSRTRVSRKSETSLKDTRKSQYLYVAPAPTKYSLYDNTRIGSTVDKSNKELLYEKISISSLTLKLLSARLQKNKVLKEGAQNFYGLLLGNIVENYLELDIFDVGIKKNCYIKPSLPLEKRVYVYAVENVNYNILLNVN